jgi:hypothetical protein
LAQILVWPACKGEPGGGGVWGVPG